MSTPTILIVEDEAIVALDLSLQLADLGYAVAGVAASGEQAITLVAEQPPDLILMDVRLQGELDGIEAAQQIRDGHDVPVIFLTSHSDDDTVRRAARTAPYGYLTKPYQLKELRAGIEVALTKSRMERQLRQADRWFAHTLRCVGDGVVVTDLDARVRFLNPAAEQLTGWSIDQAQGLPVDQVVRFKPAGASGAGLRTADGANPDQLVRAVLARGRPLPAAHGLAMQASGGDHRIVDQTAGPVDDDDGARMGAVLVLRDASARLAQEARLRASEERFRNAFDHAPLGMALVALDGGILQANDALCRLLGGTAEEVKRRNHRDLGLAEDQEHETLRLYSLLDGTADVNVVQFERRYQRLDGGEPVSTLVSVSLMHGDQDGDELGCYLYQVHDLTQQKLAAEQLAELAEERLKREASELANAAKSEFLSRASHEMRTPLNAVIGFAQLLQMLKGGDPAKTVTYAQHIRVAGEHLLTLVTDLLDLNRAAQGRLKVEPQPVNLLGAVQESLDLLSSLGQSHGVALRRAVATDLVVLADPTRLRQVLLNLGSNAIKYNRQGGDVQFLAERTTEGRIALTVADSGIGMTPEQLERLFQPFDRLGLERTRIPGVGLGLVIARSLVQEMGGTLEVTSRPRDGTTIRIALPAAA